MTKNNLALLDRNDDIPYVFEVALYFQYENLANLKRSSSNLSNFKRRRCC